MRPVQVIKVVVRHDHTKAAGRHLIYIPLGALVVAKRLWDSGSSSRYERMIRAAEATGNHEAASAAAEGTNVRPFSGQGTAPGLARDSPGAAVLLV